MDYNPVIDTTPLLPEGDGDDEGGYDGNWATPSSGFEHDSGVRMTSMTTMSKRYGEASGSGQAETSFIEGHPSGNVFHDARILDANEKLKELYPRYGRDGNFLTLETVPTRDGTTKVVAKGPKGGKYVLFTKERLNEKMPKSLFETLGLTPEALELENEQALRKLEDEISQNEEVVNDQNEDGHIRERAREKIDKYNRRRIVLENEREQLEEGLPLRERVKNIFKKHDFTIIAVGLAVGTVIGVIVEALSEGLSSVTRGVGNGLKALGKKLGQILPGMLGAIASFVFRTAGQVISFSRQERLVAGPRDCWTYDRAIREGLGKTMPGECCQGPHYYEAGFPSVVSHGFHHHRWRCCRST